jgi:hypothetical protein
MPVESPWRIGMVTDVSLTIVGHGCIVGLMQRIAVFLKPTQLDKLRKIQRETGAPVAESIRRAIDEYIKQRDAT